MEEKIPTKILRFYNILKRIDREVIKIEAIVCYCFFFCKFILSSYFSFFKVCKIRMSVWKFAQIVLEVFGLFFCFFFKSFFFFFLNSGVWIEPRQCAAAGDKQRHLFHVRSSPDALRLLPVISGQQRKKIVAKPRSNVVIRRVRLALTFTLLGEGVAPWSKTVAERGWEELASFVFLSP